MDTKHTRGPWKFVQIPTNMANAHLIAAAPDMFDMLKYLLSEMYLTTACMGHGDYRRVVQIEDTAIIQRIQQIIIKATQGEE